LKNENLMKLDEIICGADVVNEFYSAYVNDADFAHWVDKTLPDLKNCEKQKQNNPWHKYNVLGHILHSVEEINALTVMLPNQDKRMLSYVMLFHDMGKPNKHIQRMKNGEMIDSFFNHNEESEKIAKRDLPKLGFSEDDIKVMCKLIFKHDIFMFIKAYDCQNRHWRVLNEKLVQEEIADLNEVGDGKKLLSYLILIGRADNLAQNEKMTKEAIELLDKFENLLKTFKNIEKS